MRITAMSGLVLVAALAAPLCAAPAEAQSLVGEWVATAATPAGDILEKVTVAKTEGRVAITAKLVDPPDRALEAGPGFDIVLDGDKFSYKRRIDTPGGALVVDYSGVVSGDTFTGTVDLGGLAQAPYTGVRHKDQDSRRTDGAAHGQ